MAYKSLTRNYVDNFPDAANRFLSCRYISPCTIAINKEGRSPQHLTRATSRGAPFRISLIFYNPLPPLLFIKYDRTQLHQAPCLAPAPMTFHRPWRGDIVPALLMYRTAGLKGLSIPLMGGTHPSCAYTIALLSRMVSYLATVQIFCHVRPG